MKRLDKVPDIPNPRGSPRLSGPWVSLIGLELPGSMAAHLPDTFSIVRDGGHKQRLWGKTDLSVNPCSVAQWLFGKFLSFSEAQLHDLRDGKDSVYFIRWVQGLSELM